MTALLASAGLVLLGASGPTPGLSSAYLDTEAALFGLRACETPALRDAAREGRQALDDARTVIATLYGPARARRLAGASQARFASAQTVPCTGKRGRDELRAARVRLSDALRRASTAGRR